MAVPNTEVTIKIYVGTTYDSYLIWKDENGNPQPITGWSGRMQFRKNRSSDPLLLELTDANGGLIIDGPNGKVSILITSVQTAALTFSESKFWLEVWDPGTSPLYVKHLMSGTAKVISTLVA